MTHVANSADIGESEVNRLLNRLCQLETDVVYFPVRHHSPVSAAMVSRCIDACQAAAVLIEGPSDYNEHLDELLLDHQLPIAIYSYFRSSEQTRGAYYPFCEYSPEWLALKHGSQIGAKLQFIDLPWTHVARHDGAAHRYADAELRKGRYVHWLCERMQVEDFDDLWDKIVESQQQIDLDDYMQRVHSLCFHIRLWEEHISEADRLREAFMVERIQAVREEVSGPIVVVTGGFHSSALAARIAGFDCPGIDTPQHDTATVPIDQQGISLTTYSYERLDNLSGYNAGMPSPGFYEHAYRQRVSGQPFSHQPLLMDLVEQLRERKQTLSTADLIAVETSARALAAIREREHVWRRDLIDAVILALIKDELQYGCASPFLDAVHAVLRGQRRGKLAEGTRMPPLVQDIVHQLEYAKIDVSRRGQALELNLLNPKELAKSRLLHRLRILGIIGFQCTGGTDFLKRDDLQRLWESWLIMWGPEFDSSCIEASRYGPSLADAASNCLVEKAQQGIHDAVMAATLLVESAKAGIETMSATLKERLRTLIQAESQFANVATALGHLTFLYHYDEAFGTANLPQVGEILSEAFVRSLWLLELLGNSPDVDGSLVRGMQAIQETYRRADQTLEIDHNEYIQVLSRVEQDKHKPPAVRGAAAGILWSLGEANSEQVLGDLLTFADASQLGDFLTGLFALAREVAQRDPQLVQTIDRLLLEFGSDDFQAALPSLRLAFTYFTPREKHHMLTTLFESLGLKDVRPLDKLTVNAAVAAEALAMEERIFEALQHYGLEADHE
ncbi:hypothetical protein DTL42_13165 [Bremerella cremea]|uniref:Uncharacterized protein n=1 Tax=Bremerella cremea TaxID=1031537 RepID=A0A368KRF2_9BACT|nr:DUF5682 family protein [Bremerella cremea]RCS49468.1 hypothetical protein DTL42_13165 [Bremerella cremea]